MNEPDRQLSVSGARLRFRDEGTGPAILLIHGWTLDLDMWEPQVRELRDVLRLIRHDRRGFGLSTGKPSLAADVSDVLALCEHLNLRSVALLGMSQGARVAAQVSALNPGLVSRVIFDGPPSGTVAGSEIQPSDIPLAKLRHLARVGGVEAFRKEWRKHPLTKLQTRDSRSRELLERMIERYRAEDLLSATDAGSAPTAPTAPPLPTASPTPPPTMPPSPALSSVAPPPEAIRAPALIISGAFDLESRFSAAEALAKALPSSERAIVPRAGHLPNLDNPAAYNALLRRFLTRPALQAGRSRKS
ncbi:MAG TPA: alpha/beta hydrolase [Steroidobacteraceae bacterium]|nr:alpha/beta hydrolase [Steroidobacteraceae bacterium]